MCAVTQDPKKNVRLAKQMNFPIDAVFTWVDGASPEWLTKKRKRADEIAQVTGKPPPPEAQDIARFLDNDELRMALRSFAMYAPWIRKIHIVTAGQKPSWLSTRSINLVNHKDIFPNQRLLPVFSTRPIELCVHRIPDLAEHFIYANDDFMLGRPLAPTDFFTSGGDPLVWAVKRSKAYFEEQKAQKGKVVSSHTRAVNLSCDVIRSFFGAEFPYRMRHYPKAMTRSTAEQVWVAFPEHVARTLASPFRSNSDISITMLYPLFLLATGQGNIRVINGIRQIVDYLFGGIAHIGASLGDENLEKKMQAILKYRPKTFCLNDSRSASEKDRERLRQFLFALFPAVSPFEMAHSPGESR